MDNQNVTHHDLLRQAIAGLNAVLPIQAPLQDFVHFNPLMHYEHLPFADALREAHRQSGSLGYLPANEYRQFFQQGRINRRDLHAILTEDGVMSEEQDIWLTVLLHDIKPISFQQMHWQVEENHALERFQSDIPFSQREKLLAACGQTEAEAIRLLWETCLQQLGLHYELPHPENLLHLNTIDFGKLWTDLNQHGQDGKTIEDAESFINAESRHLLHQLCDDVGTQFTLRGLLKRLTATDVMDDILPLLGRHLASWLDHGLSSLHPEATGFYAYWREAMRNDPTSWLSDREDWADYLNSLHDDPLETIHQELMRIGIEKTCWANYLQTLALELPGWSGMVNWRSQRANYLGLPAAVDMADYLAVRLVLEHLYCRQLTSSLWQINASINNIRGYFHQHLDEFFVRYHAYNTTLPEYLQHIAQQFFDSSEDIRTDDWHQLAHQILTWNLAPESIIPVDSDIYRKAWRLFHLAQHLALDAQQCSQQSPAQIERLLTILTTLDDPNTSGYLWLRAYEHHFQEEVFSAILNKGSPASTTAPEAQLMFCMDDREESIRRHLEEIAPEMETLGAAGVFGLPNNWRGLDAPKPLKLAQPVVTAVHEFREVVAAEVVQDGTPLRRHQRRQKLLNSIKRLKYHQMRHGIWGTALSLPLFAPFALVELLGRSFLPASYQRFFKKTYTRISLPLKTRVAYDAETVLECPTGEHNQVGLSLEEKVSKVATFLKLSSFTENFAPLVVLMAHRSRHLNNPHILGYGCGACSGRFGGPNARAFAGIMNEAAVRQRLADEHHIKIPDSTWFIAAEHDTSSDDIDWFDTDLLPAQHLPLFQRVQQVTAQAASRSAHERCRKFASASLRLSLAQAKAHVEGRAASPDQVRAELGHQGCAIAFIAPRKLSQGIFWDRRSFLISYDAKYDPEGHTLEAQLQGNGVVGIGIQMDYYFSRMQNGYYGSGSKATHNLTGLFGVMEGGSSDLRTGLAQQMVELHEPMRLLVVVEAEPEVLEKIYHRHNYLRQLLDNGWVLLATKRPDHPEIHVFKPKLGFVRWSNALHPLPQVPRSLDWYGGQRGYLSPAAIQPTEREITHA